MRDALSGRSGDGAPEPPPPPPGPPPTVDRPVPLRPTTPDAPGRLRNNPLDEEDPPEQTVTTTFTPHAFKTTPE